MRKLLAAFLALVFCFGLSSCTETDTEQKSPVTTSSTVTGGTVFPEGSTPPNYPDNTPGYQLNLPKSGETVAIMHTSIGDIHIRLFPEAAPKAVENFVTHAKNGYYNGLTFHRVIEDFMIQGGDPAGTGAGGESIWGTAFEDEFSANLMNLRGSLAMANSGINTNGSQFFINQGDAASFSQSYTTLDAYKQLCQENEDTLKSEYDSLVASFGKDVVEEQYGTWEKVLSQYSPNAAALAPSDAVWELYKQYGGNLHLDGAWRRSGGHTVFGQVYYGMNVVDAIAAVEVDSNSKPLTAVTITSIEITTYQG